MWLVASVPADNVTIADWDLAAALDMAASHDRDGLQAAFEASCVPFAAYRMGQYRRPEALVTGGIAPDRLALLATDDPADCSDNERVYGRQLHRLLRAMIGAPPAAPLAALVGAAIARGRATLVAAHTDNERRIKMYRIDNGSGYFAFDAVLAALLGSDAVEAGPG